MDGMPVGTAAVALLALASDLTAATLRRDETLTPELAARLRAPRAALRRAGVEHKVESHLRALAWPTPGAGPSSSHLRPLPLLQPAHAGRARIYVRLDDASPRAVDELRAAGVEIEIVNPEHRLVQGLVEPRRLPALAAHASVRSIRPVLRGMLRTGSVNSEGDGAARADLVRGLGYDGTGVVVGVISDGIDNRSSAQALGDLGAVTVPVGCGFGSGDEGTAILEIVHDLAPGAPLLFSEGLTSSLAFIDSVDCLRAAGAHVIIDDIGYFDEPFFADGPVAQAVRAAVEAGVSFHSAAGNDADRHYEATYQTSPSTSFHDFDGGSVDNFDGMIVPGGETIVCVLQWNDPFGGSANDYDLYLFDESQQEIDSSTSTQNGTQDPIEIVGATNPGGSPALALIAIDRFAGATRELEMFCFGSAAAEYVTPTGAIFGHPGIPESVALGAIDALDPGLDEIEAFSSRGPARIFFPSLSVRAKPDLAAFDGVSTTNPGGFPSCPPFCAFFGTSAAAPHSAAVAALLLSKNPFLAPATIRDVMRTTAVDIGAVGFDDAAGAGRLDALAAANAVSEPECFSAAECPADTDPCTVEACAGGVCTQAPASCDDGDACTGTESCDPAVGCVAGVPPACLDADPCTVDGCDPQVGCQFPELPGIDYLGCALALRLAPLVPGPETAASRRAARTLRRLQARLAKAEARVAAATALGSGRRARKKLKRAGKLVRAMGKVAGSSRSDLAPEVAQPIVQETDLIAVRIDTVRLFL